MTDTLIVFDFDWTLIDENSDTYVVEQLTPDLKKEMSEFSKKNPGKWTQLMDLMMSKIWARGFQAAELENCLRTIPLRPAMADAIRLAHNSGCTLRIVSDANTVFIRTILQAYKLDHCFDEVISNHAHYDSSGALRVLPYHKHPPPHSCPLCPPNLCKGSVITKMQNEKIFRRVIYLGDGAGDFCPSCKLRGEETHVLARRGWALGKLIKEHPGDVSAVVHLWESADDVLRSFSAILKPSQP